MDVVGWLRREQAAQGSGGEGSGRSATREMNMDRATTLQILKTHKAHLARDFGVTDLALFGSVAEERT